MNREELENNLKQYFQQESARGDLPAQQWQEMLSQVKEQQQRRWLWGFMTPLTARPALAVAGSLVLAVAVGGASLWLAAPWEGTAPANWGPPIADQPVSDRPSPVDSPHSGPSRAAGAPGAPAPRLLSAQWPDKGRYLPGEPIALTVTLNNPSSETQQIADFPGSILLYLLDDPNNNSVTVASGKELRSLAPNEEATVRIDVPGEVTRTLQPGRYLIHVEVRLTNGTRLGLNSGPIITILFPQGALEKTVMVGEVREASGVRITLESIQFTPEGTTIVALAVLTGYKLPARLPSLPPPAPGATPTPAPTATPVGREYSTSPWYRIDGGEWQGLMSLSNRETPEGIHLEWTLGPVPADGKTLDFSMSQLDNLIFNPGPGQREQVIGPWEWTVSLQTGE